MTRFKEKITKHLNSSPPSRSQVLKRNALWIGLAVTALVLDRILPTSFWEKIYYRGIFIGWRVSYDFLLGYSPVPMIYLVACAVVVRIIKWLRQWKKGFRFQAVRALGGLAAVVFFFYFFWAFNYRQVPLPQKLGFNYKEVTPEDIRQEFERASASLEWSAKNLPPNETDDFSLSKKAVRDGDLRMDVEATLGSLGLPHFGRVRVRQLWPKGFLLRWNTAGIYIPQAGEGHIDEGLLSIQKPFTLAHEMAHGYGVTDEGVCNFIAWLSCEQSMDPWVRYSGALTYWKYAAYEMAPDSVQQRMKTFPPVVEQSMWLIRENDKKYPDLFPRYRDAIYSSYLKHHGVREGLRSYNEVVLMVQQYLKRKSMGADSK